MVTTAPKQSIVREFDPKRVRALPGQPRKRFRGIKELADSIFEIGQSCPGIVTLVDDDPAFDAQLVDGERRLRACRMVGVAFRAEVRADAAAEEIFVASFAANFGKQDHDTMEIAEGLGRMQRAGKTLAQLSRISGNSVGWVQQYLSLLRLHPDVQAMLVDGEGEDARAPLNFTLALLLVPLAPDAQLDYARRFVKAGISLPAARRMIAKARTRAGHKSAYAGRKAEGIENMMAELVDRVGVYLDMPGTAFNRMVDGIDHATKRKLIKSIDETAELLATLSEAVRARLPKAGPRGN